VVKEKEKRKRKKIPPGNITQVVVIHTIEMFMQFIKDCAIY
jgi:hypothetical protein